MLRNVLPDVPRSILSRDDPPAEPEQESPVPRNMKISKDILKKFGYTPGCATCSNCLASHPSLAHSQDCRIRIEAASKEDTTYRDRVERAEQRKMDFNAKEVEQVDHARRASLEPSGVPRPPAAETEAEDLSCVREAKRAREELVRDPCGAIRCDSVELDSTSDLSGSETDVQ